MTEYLAIRIDREWKHFEECFKLWNKILPEESRIVEKFKPLNQEKLEIVFYKAEWFQDLDFNQAPFHPCRDASLTLRIDIQQKLGAYSYKKNVTPVEARQAYHHLISQTPQEILKTFPFKKMTTAAKNPFKKTRNLPSTSISTTLDVTFRYLGEMFGFHDSYTIFCNFFQPVQGTYDPETGQLYIASINGEKGRLTLVESEEKGAISEVSTGILSLEKKLKP